MKNSLSKTLLCGVLATSFLLVNCQRAPSRGVKAKTGTDNSAQQKAQTPANKDAAAGANKDKDSANTATDAGNSSASDGTNKGSSGNAASTASGNSSASGGDSTSTADGGSTNSGKKIVECSPAAKDAVIALKTKIDDVKKVVDVATDDSSQLLTSADDLKDKSDAAVKAFQDLKVDGCYVVDANKVKSAAYMIQYLKYGSDQLIVQIQQKTGKTTDKTKDVPVEKDKADSEYVKKEIFTKNAVMYVREALADKMDSDHKDGEVYFVNGEMLTGVSNYETALENKSKTVCMISEADSEKLTKNTKVTLLTPTVTAATKLKNAVLVVGLSSGDRLYAFTCQIADGKESQMELEFLKAIGKDHLITKAKYDKEVKSTEDSETKDALKKKLKKLQVVVSDKKDTLDTKKKDLKAAKEKRDDAKTKLDEATTAEASATSDQKLAATTARKSAQTVFDTAKKAVDTAQDEVDAAQKAYDKAVQDKTDAATE